MPGRSTKWRGRGRLVAELLTVDETKTSGADIVADERASGMSAATLPFNGALYG
jgi:hypothetical protein